MGSILLSSLRLLQDSLVIVSRLDDTSAGAACRLALYGSLVALVNPDSPGELSRLRVFKVKQKEGNIERVLPDGRTAICKGFFKKESDFSAFLNLKVCCFCSLQRCLWWCE